MNPSILQKMTLFCFLSILFLNSCVENLSRSSHETDSVLDSIMIFAQAQPHGEARDMKMAVNQALDKWDIQEPQMVDMDSSDLVIGMLLDSMPIAFPIKFLSGFEVANFSFDRANYLLTWCPLVGSSRVFDGDPNGKEGGFDFGRALKDNNLLMVDRKTKTVWNQISGEGILGELKGEELKQLPSIQGTWSFWRAKHPSSKIAVAVDTSNAVFPEFVMEIPYYNNWGPGDQYAPVNEHHADRLGLGVELDSDVVFFPLTELFQEKSPISYVVGKQEVLIHFDELGMTAWAEDKAGEVLPNTIVYDYSWANFYPDSKIYKTD